MYLFTQKYTSLLFIFLLSSTFCLYSDDLENKNKQLKGFVEKYCLDCHDTETAKGDFDLEKMLTHFDTKNLKLWERMVLRIEAGEMPPPKKKQPQKTEADSALNHVKVQLANTARKERSNGRVMVRRLNRIEYENTLHNLFDTTVPLKDLLPEDEISHGFTNSSEALSISPVHIQQYMAAADRVLNQVIPRKPVNTQKYTFEYTHEKEKPFWGHGHNKQYIRPRDGKIWFYNPTHIEVPAYLRQFSLITRKEPGFYKVKITAKADSTKGKMITWSFWKAKHNKRTKLLGFFDALPDQESSIEKTLWFEPNESIIVAPYHMSKYRTDAGFSKYAPKNGLPKDWKKSGKFYEPEGPALVIYPVEIEGPIQKKWPPKGYTELFGKTPLVPHNELPKRTIIPDNLARIGHRVDGKWLKGLTPAMPKDPAAEAKNLLQSFMHKAFRRPVSDEDIEPYLNLAKQFLSEKQTFEVVMLNTYKAVLCSPDFLFIEEKPGRLSDHALATRLSYFLWRTSPDDRLLELADKGKLSDPNVLKQEALRMIESKNSKAFVDDFLDHWLHLKDIQATTPDRDLYPEYFTNVFNNEQDRLLLYSSIDETKKTFSHLLYENKNALEMVDADYVWVNKRLAEFYGLPPIDGVELRKVTLPKDSVRGGVITQSSILKVTANGATTSPVLRGVWLLENIMGLPAPPPPPNAGSIEPDTRGSTTIREQLEKHKSTKSCAACHRMIDPPGFALEMFDPIGLQRERYRSTEKGDKVDKKFFHSGSYRKVKYKHAAEVDSTGVLFSQMDFKGPAEFKKHLLTRHHNIIRCLTGKLITFATGHHPEPSDLLELDRLVTKNRSQNYGVKSLILEIIQSPLFTEK